MNGLADFSKRSCNGTHGRNRMLCFDFVLAGYYGYGVIGTFRDSLLWSPTDVDADNIKMSIRGWTQFYRNYTKARPSGAAGVLLGQCPLPFLIDAVEWGCGFIDLPKY